MFKVLYSLGPMAWLEEGSKCEGEIVVVVYAAKALQTHEVVGRAMALSHRVCDQIHALERVS